jgi:outer membrane lipoprotein SlyB
MKRTFLLPALLVSAGLLSACQPSNPYQAQANCTVGTVGGAAIGGIVGNQFGGGAGRDLATVGGAIAGGLIGSNASCY